MLLLNIIERFYRKSTENNSRFCKIFILAKNLYVLDDMYANVFLVFFHRCTFLTVLIKIPWDLRYFKFC